MKKFILILFATITLLSCKTTDDSIPFEVYENLPIITANVNDLPVKFLIDTGSTSSLIDISTQSLLLFNHDTDVPMEIAAGIGGDTFVFGIKDINLEINGEKMDITFKGTDLRSTRFYLGVVGIIGSDFLLENNIVIDYPNRKIIYKDLE